MSDGQEALGFVGVLQLITDVSKMNGAQTACRVKVHKMILVEILIVPLAGVRCVLRRLHPDQHRHHHDSMTCLYHVNKNN